MGSIHLEISGQLLHAHIQVVFVNMILMISSYIGMILGCLFLVSFVHHNHMMLVTCVSVSWITLWCALNGITNCCCTWGNSTVQEENITCKMFNPNLP